jgi:hypothetical protein
MSVPVEDLRADATTGDPLGVPLSTNSVRLIRQKALFGGQVSRTDIVALCNEVMALRAPDNLCRFPECAAPPETPTGMCHLHRKVTIADGGSYVDDSHREGGHG